MKPPSPFCQQVIEILKRNKTSSMPAWLLREALLARGWGKHPAAVAMNLTKLAMKSDYITGYCNNEGRVFMLTSNA